MSIRYSGDAEIRIFFDERKRTYRGTVVDPYLRFRGTVPLLPRFARTPRSPEAYDSAARRLAEKAQHCATHTSCGFRSPRPFALDQTPRGGVKLRRVFQSPCPID